MDSYIVLMAQLAATWLSGPLILLALLVLLLKSRSAWLLLAVLGECASVFVRFAVASEPSLFSHLAMLQVVPPIAALLVATGLLGYALSAGRRDVDARLRT